MTKDEFISYTKGIIASEMERARLEMLSERKVGDIQLAGALKLIKDALDSIQTEYLPEHMRGFHTLDPFNDYVSFYEKCSCNPKNGGSGVCGCTLGSPKTYC